MPTPDPIKAMEEGEEAELHVEPGGNISVDDGTKTEKGAKMKPTRWA